MGKEDHFEDKKNIEKTQDRNDPLPPLNRKLISPDIVYEKEQSCHQESSDYDIDHCSISFPCIDDGTIFFFLCTCVLCKKDMVRNTPLQNYAIKQAFYFEFISYTIRKMSGQMVPSSCLSVHV